MKYLEVNKLYLARKSEDGTRVQKIIEHAEETAGIAADFAEVFGCRDWGYGCGLLHDIGKYSLKFQERLNGGKKTDHATAGAQELFRLKNIMAAYCVAGHHTGLPDGGTPVDAAGEPTLQGRMQKQVEDYMAFKDEIEIPAFSDPPLLPLGRGGFSLSFFIRMLYSCLVDADSLDAEAFMTEQRIKRGEYDGIEVLWDRLSAHVMPWLNVTDNATVNGRRTSILHSCLKKGQQEQGVYQLTVPTGGGKTISSLAFALQHARKHNLKRIIYVIPYTSIIEQNAQVFKNILGRHNVLEDHSNVNYTDSEELQRFQLAAENWDMPIVVTTNVQFFESLFANKKSKCRKLHNIAGSVIIFDEAQMLPVNYLKPCIQAISELVTNYHSTAVLCTATQPALQRFFPEQIKVREICSDVTGQYKFFKRTNIQNAGEISEDQLIEQLRTQNQVLCILNSRKRVQRVFEALQGEGIYHLSTFMYPHHRKRLLKEIKERLHNKLPCKLIATSLVEEGVDFDFKTVYREMAGIDSMIQAAGRCNREGKRNKDECKTIVFILEADDEIKIPQAMKLPISVGQEVAGEYEDISSLAAIEAYFTRLFDYRGEGLDQKRIVEQFEDGVRSRLFPFATVAKEFRLIENKTVTVMIDLELEAKTIVQRIRRGEHSRQLMRDAGMYCVNIYENDFTNMQGAGKLEQLEVDYYLLRNNKEYTEDMGLVINAGRGDAVFG